MNADQRVVDEHANFPILNLYLFFISDEFVSKKCQKAAYPLDFCWSSPSL